MDPETERLIAAADAGRAHCHQCGATVTHWRLRTIYRQRETVELFYCTSCGEFAWGLRGFPEDPPRGE
jgi:NAD-dependent SIR2 family protein deacetylase